MERRGKTCETCTNRNQHFQSGKRSPIPIPRWLVCGTLSPYHSPALTPGLSCWCLPSHLTSTHLLPQSEVFHANGTTTLSSINLLNFTSLGTSFFLKDADVTVASLRTSPCHFSCLQTGLAKSESSLSSEMENSVSENRPQLSSPFGSRKG